MSNPWFVDRDPGDETPVETHPESTGLCASPFCDDAALPGEEYCRECFAELVAWEDSMTGDAA